MTGFRVVRAGPAMTLQDGGRPGWMSRGLSRGGAADPTSLAEGAALLGQTPELAALEMAGAGGAFEAEGNVLVALAGAPMAARLDGRPLEWAASHAVPKGATLEIGGARAGVYGYLHVAGGFGGAEILGARSAHLAAGLGAAVATGDFLTLRDPPTDATGAAGKALDPLPRFEGGVVRFVPGIQTERFGKDTLERFQKTEFRRGARANRMGVALESGDSGFVADGQLDTVSEVVVPGDIQMTGDGQPYVLLSECQTTGGYPRIGTVLACDLGTVAQAPQGAKLEFVLVDMPSALDAQARHKAAIDRLPRSVRPLTRQPGDVEDLLAHQLVSGAVSALDDRMD